MGSLFKKPKAPENREQKELVRRQREEIAEQESEMNERRAARRRFSRGRASLLSGSETGIPQRETLG